MLRIRAWSRPSPNGRGINEKGRGGFKVGAAFG